VFYSLYDFIALETIILTVYKMIQAALINTMKNKIGSAHVR